MPVKISEKQAHIMDFLQKNRIGVLATVDPNGEPHAATIYFTVDSNMNIAFITKTETKKHDNIQHNDHVVLIVFEANTQTTVQVKGMASVVTDPVKEQEIFAEILKVSMDTSESGIPPISKLRAGEYVVYTIKSKEIRMAVYIRPDPGDYETLFETINL